LPCFVFVRLEEGRHFAVKMPEGDNGRRVSQRRHAWRQRDRRREARRRD
jgi:hypothetical protein